MTRTLVVHTGAIGDFLLACPAIAQLMKHGVVELAGNRTRLDLAVAGGIAAVAHDLDTIDFHSLFTEPSVRLQSFLQQFDRAVVWMRDEGGTIRNGLQSCGLAHVEVFPGLPDMDWTRHASAYYAECLGFRDLPPLRLRIPPLGPPLDVVIHPGSGSVKKNAPLGLFRTLAQEHRACRRDVVWCLGPAETERGVVAQLDGDMLQCESLVTLAGRLSTARQFIGNDSGITHLAAALGVPTLAIFGPTTNPRVWAPLGEHVRVATGEPWPDAEGLFLLSS